MISMFILSALLETFVSMYCEPGSGADGVYKSVAVAEITSQEVKHFV